MPDRASLDLKLFREAMEIVKENLKSTGLGPAKFLVSDARNYIRKASGREIFDLVFVDPPYALECCSDIMRKLADGGMLAKGALVVLESGTEIINADRFPDFELTKTKQYGKKTALNIFFYKGKDE